MSEPPPVIPIRAVTEGMGKGCLGGLGLVLAFFAISAAVYLLLGMISLSANVRLLVTFLSGPILGTMGVVGVLLIRSHRAMQDYMASREYLINSDSDDSGA
jgi:hypothetical protein